MITIKDIAEDLSIAAEIESEYSYRLSDDEKHILAQDYTDEGFLSSTYRIDITITKED